ncbi:histidine kinase [Microbacterium sp. Marseille-Q6965]|uniref:histidine kinase n=1 Tax=Microbacterium sp. Marseille-Q6965 TaxID=2965072 RepID=UPI0021B7C4DE|nr:histidine kinase [Microbacterium sp. Marseille-Q6965]
MADVTRPDVGPWTRFSWALGVIWIVCMFFPLAAALESDAAPVAKVTAVALLVAFAVLYVATFVWLTRSASWEQAARRGLPALAVMAALMIAAAVLVGPGALGAGPFLIALAMFSGPRAASYAMSSAIAVALATALVLSGGLEHQWVVLLPTAFVLIACGLVRAIDGAQDDHNELARQLAIVEERERVARDVHDVLGHSLTVVTVKAELAERLIDGDPVAAKAELAQIRSLTREALAELRATVAGLRVARLGDELQAARAALADAGIDADVPDEADTVDPPHRIVVAWTLREAVTNVVRHSRAERCAVRLAPRGIVVEDDGIGTPAEVAATGLRGIRERAEAAGATLTVGPARELGASAAARAGADGTRIEVRW